MAMRISPQPFFWANVEFEMVGDFGQRVPVSFKGKFLRVQQDEYETLMRRLQAARVAALRDELGPEATKTLPAAPADAQGAPRLTDREIIDKYLLDWQDMVGDDDQPLAFTKDNLAQAEKVLGCRGAIVRAFFDAHHKAPEKNSEQPSGTSTGG